MKKTMFALIIVVALTSGLSSLHAADLLALSDDGVKCTFTHHDRWKGKISSEGMLFIGMYGENSRVYIAWGKNKDTLVQKNEFSLKKEAIDPKKEPQTPIIPFYQEFTDMLKKALEWEATAEENGLEDIQKLIALGWAYHKPNKRTPGWISKTWGSDASYELVELKIRDIPKLLNLLDEVPDLEKRLQENRKKLQEDEDRKKAEAKAKKEKVDSLLK
jgi:hypothetical protein